MEKTEKADVKEIVDEFLEAIQHNLEAYMEDKEIDTHELVKIMEDDFETFLDNMEDYLGDEETEE